MAPSSSLRYQTLLFDWDGTVADSREAILAAFTATFAHFGEAAPAASVIEATIGMQLAEAMVRLCPRAAGHEQAWLDVYRQHSLQQETLRTRLFDGILEVVDTALRRGAHIGIVSNKSQSGLEAAANRFRLGSRIDFFVGTAPGLPRKPEAGMFHQQVRPRLRHDDLERVLMIGDTTIDLQFARNAGIDSCWAGYGYGRRPECEAMAPTHAIQHPSGMLAILRVGPDPD